MKGQTAKFFIFLLLFVVTSTILQLIIGESGDAIGNIIAKSIFAGVIASFIFVLLTRKKGSRDENKNSDQA